MTQDLDNYFEVLPINNDEIKWLSYRPEIFETSSMIAIQWHQ